MAAYPSWPDTQMKLFATRASYQPEFYLYFGRDQPLQPQIDYADDDSVKLDRLRRQEFGNLGRKGRRLERGDSKDTLGLGSSSTGK